MVKPVVAPPAPPPQKNEKVLGAARMYEQQFLREMMRAMRNTVVEGELIPTSMGEKIFRQQLDDHHVDQWTERGGVGFADMIYEHIMEKYYGQTPQRSRVLQAYDNVRKPGAGGKRGGE